MTKKVRTKKGNYVGLWLYAPRLLLLAHSYLLAGLLCFLAGCATNGASPDGSPFRGRSVLFPEPAALPPQGALPDPLLMLDGRQVNSREQWFQERRPELKALFEHYMYGQIPPKPAQMRSKVVGEYKD